MRPSAGLSNTGSTKSLVGLDASGHALDSSAGEAATAQSALLWAAYGLLEKGARRAAGERFDLAWPRINSSASWRFQHPTACVFTTAGISRGDTAVARLVAL